MEQRAPLDSEDYQVELGPLGLQVSQEFKEKEGPLDHPDPADQVAQSGQEDLKVPLVQLDRQVRLAEQVVRVHLVPKVQQVPLVSPVALVAPGLKVPEENLVEQAQSDPLGYKDLPVPLDHLASLDQAAQLDLLDHLDNQDLPELREPEAKEASQVLKGSRDPQDHLDLKAELDQQDPQDSQVNQDRWDPVASKGPVALLDQEDHPDLVGLEDKVGLRGCLDPRAELVPPVQQDQQVLSDLLDFLDQLDPAVRMDEQVREGLKDSKDPLDRPALLACLEDLVSEETVDTPDTQVLEVLVAEQALLVLQDPVVTMGVLDLQVSVGHLVLGDRLAPLVLQDQQVETV